MTVTGGQAQPEQYVLSIGDIGVSPSWVVTPNGTAPLAGSQWWAIDRTYVHREIPTYAIVLAVVFLVVCFLGLLFLLIKEETTAGYVEVTVRSQHLTHTTQVAASSPQAVMNARQIVHQAQTMAARAGA